MLPSESGAKDPKVTSKTAPQLAERLDRLQDVMNQLARESLRAQQEIAALAREMRNFKGEVLELKDEMSAFKGEIRAFKEDLGKKLAELSRKMGTLVEDIVAPNLPQVARELFACKGPE